MSFLLLTVLSLLLPTAARAAHENIAIDGNLTDLITAVNNNLGPDRGGFTAPDPLGEIYPLGGCNFVNGYDIRQTYVLIDFKDAMGNLTPNDIALYAGWDVEGIVGDVDGDGNPNTFSMAGPGAVCGAFADGAGIGDDESYNVLLNLDCAGAIDDIRIQIKSNQVLKVVGGVTSVIPGAVFAFSGDKLELKVPNYQNLITGLPITTDLCDARIRMLANAEFDFLGEDLTSAFQLELAPSILVEKNPSVQDICAGESIDWTITVTNTGLCRLDDITVEDILGAGMSFGNSNTVPTSVIDQTIRWEYPGIGLLPGQSINLTLTATTMSPCPSPVLTNNVTVEGAHFNPCLGPGAPPATANSMDSATVNCRDLPACDIAGDLSTCFPSSETYSTTVGAPFARAWSVTSTPPGICNTSDPLDGSSITVNFTGAGVCTVSLTITDPLNPEVCQKTCTQLVTVNPKPPCLVEGDLHTCFPMSETYSTNVGPNYTKSWSVTSNPPGIGSTSSALDGDAITVDFTGAGSCTVSLTVTDPMDPTDCVTVCTQVVDVDAQPPCDISGDFSTCLTDPGPTTETYTTTVGAEYNRQWSVVSDPADICNFTTPTNGGSVGLSFTGTGVCTLTLTVTDPMDPTDCVHVCSQVITINPIPPCDIEGDDHTCFPMSETYTTTVGDQYTRAWSVTSNPPGIGSISGATNGGSVAVDFTGAGSCTLTLTVTDPNDPNDCGHVCTKIIDVDAQPPCDITGDLHLCLLDPGPTTGTYSTGVGAGYNKLWSISGVGSIDGPMDGDQVTVSFTGAGQCTLTLRVTDPMDPEDCFHECSQVITIDPLPPCDISGDLFTCLKDPGPSTETYTTTVGAEYSRVWSTTSNPPGISSFVGGNTGGSVVLGFTGTGICTLTLTVTDPNDPDDCGHVCTQIITVSPAPPCNIIGDDHTCSPSTETYTTTIDSFSPGKKPALAGGAYAYLWSATSTPDGICSIVGPNDGESVALSFTGAGTCTLKLEVFDPDDPTDCLSMCTKIIEIGPQPPCDIAGDPSLCLLDPGPTTETYTTTVGAEYDRNWSLESNPPGIGAFIGGASGGSVTLGFTGVGTCTLTLTVTDPTDRDDCGHVCTQIINVMPTPPCNIEGDDHTCFPMSETYTTSVGDNYTRVWSVTSNPPGIGNIPGATNGGSVTVDFTGAGSCTLKLEVFDPGDPEDCLSVCTYVIESDPQPPCDITGDLHTCFPSSETYTTPVGDEFNRLWSVTSDPPGICNTSGPLDGGSVTVNFTAAGQCTVTLRVTDPMDPTDCVHECTRIVTVAPQPPCNIAGDPAVCLLEIDPTNRTYTTTAGSEYNRQWSAVSVPPGIFNFTTATDGGSVGLNFTGTGVCTLTLTVTDPMDPEDCVHVCTQVIDVTDAPPCNIEGDDHTCFPMSETYTTTAGDDYTRAWSVTSNPPGICNIPGAADGGSVTVDFTAAGSCTLTLTVSDPSDPEKCLSTCTRIIESDPQPLCDIAGDLHTCLLDPGPTTETYTTSVGAEYNRLWSVTSNPPGICTTSGPLDGDSVMVNFTAAGQCTVTLRITDPADPEDCFHECSQIVTIAPKPPCDISGDLSTCLRTPGPTTETYTTSVGAEYNRQWSVVSDPPGICDIPGATDGGSVTLNFTGTGVCTLTLTVVDPNDREDCGHVCTQIINVLPTPLCDISGDEHTCFPMSETYTTTVGAGYTKLWSVTSNPPGICSITGPTNGGSVAVNFTDAGACTLKLEVFDSNDPTDCLSMCTRIIESDPQPPCNISGNSATILTVPGPTTETYTTTVGAEYNRQWSATSNPAGICSFTTPTNGGSVTLAFTGVGACTLTLTVTDPMDPTDCIHVCTRIIQVTQSTYCDIVGDDPTCFPSSETYSTTVGPGYIKLWSATSTPPGICNIPGPTNGNSVTINFTGAGTCTLSLKITPANGTISPPTICTRILEIGEKPSCNVAGEANACFPTTGNYTTTIGAGYDRQWSVTSTPPGICNTSGPLDGGSVAVNFTGAGQCTVTLTVTDPMDPTVCVSQCTQVVTVEDCGEPEICKIKGCGCMRDSEDCDKIHRFGGQLTASSSFWRHKVIENGRTLFRFQSCDAQVDSCWNAVCDDDRDDDEDDGGDDGDDDDDGDNDDDHNWLSGGRTEVTRFVTPGVTPQTGDRDDEDDDRDDDCGCDCDDDHDGDRGDDDDDEGDEDDGHDWQPGTRASLGNLASPGITPYTGDRDDEDDDRDDDCGCDCDDDHDGDRGDDDDDEGDEDDGHDWQPGTRASLGNLASPGITPYTGDRDDEDDDRDDDCGCDCDDDHDGDRGDDDDDEGDEDDGHDWQPGARASLGNLASPGITPYTGDRDDEDDDRDDDCGCDCDDDHDGDHGDDDDDEGDEDDGHDWQPGTRASLGNLASPGITPYTVDRDDEDDDRDDDCGCDCDDDHDGDRDDDEDDDHYTRSGNNGSIKNIAWSGTGRFRFGRGDEMQGTFTARATDTGRRSRQHGDCECRRDYYEITVYDLNGGVVFRTSGFLGSGDLRIQSLTGDPDYSVDADLEVRTSRITPTGGADILTTRPYPNPVTAGASSITWSIPTGTAPAAVSMTIFDVTGRVVRFMDLGVQVPGEHAVNWDLRDENGGTITSGIYFYRLIVGNEAVTSKLMVVHR